MADSNGVAQLLLLGSYTHDWQCFGQKVQFALPTSGEEEGIQRAVSGLDLISRSFVKDTHDLAHALLSIGGYDFGNSLEEKLKTVRAMNLPLRRMFLDELESARRLQHEKFQELVKGTKT